MFKKAITGQGVASLVLTGVLGVFAMTVSTVEALAIEDKLCNEGAHVVGFEANVPLCSDEDVYQVTQRIVFVTSEEFSGDLGGLEGADAKCAVAAKAANLDGTFKAWLSVGPDSAASRHTLHDVPYVAVDGTMVVTSGLDFITPGVDLLTPININENGTPLQRDSWPVIQRYVSPNSFPSGGDPEYIISYDYEYPTEQRVWSNTAADGTTKITDSTGTCFGFTSTSDPAMSWAPWAPTGYGPVGQHSSTTDLWTDQNDQQECSTYHRLYCLQQ